MRFLKRGWEIPGHQASKHVQESGFVFCFVSGFVFPVSEREPRAQVLEVTRLGEGRRKGTRRSRGSDGHGRFTVQSLVRPPDAL